MIDEAKLRLVAADTAQSEYEQLRDQLKEVTESRMTDEPVTEELKRKLAEFEQKLVNLKGEALYSAQDWFLKGLKSRRSEDYQTTLDYYDRAIALDPAMEEGHIQRSSVLNAMGRYEEALRASDRAIKLDPQFAGGYISRGMVLSRLGRFEEALTAEDRAVELDPDNAISHSNRAWSLHWLGRFEEAVEACDRSLDLDPSEPAPNLIAGLTSLVLSDYEEALRRSKAAPADSAELRFQAGYLYLQCIAEKLMGENTSKTEEGFDDILKKDYVHNWSLHQIENWLKTADIPDDARKFIIEKTELLKAKQRKKG